MGAVFQDCPTGSTVMTEMGAGEIVPDTLSCELKRSRGRAPLTDLDRAPMGILERNHPAHDCTRGILGP